MKKVILRHRIMITNDKGKLHSYNDKPAVKWFSGRSKGIKSWWRNGIRHRTNGPAIIWNDGIKEYYIEGTRIFPLVTKRLFFRKKEIWMGRWNQTQE